MTSPISHYFVMTFFLGGGSKQSKELGSCLLLNQVLGPSSAALSPLASPTRCLPDMLNQSSNHLQTPCWLSMEGCSKGWWHCSSRGFPLTYTDMPGIEPGTFCLKIVCWPVDSPNKSIMSLMMKPYRWLLHIFCSSVYDHTHRHTHPGPCITSPSGWEFHRC